MCEGRVAAVWSYANPTDAVFAGSRVGPSGIRTDLSLENVDGVIEPGRFHWNLRRNSIPLLRPLMDLVAGLDVPKGKGRASYRRAMKGQPVTLWRGCGRKNMCTRSSD